MAIQAVYEALASAIRREGAQRYIDLWTASDPSSPNNPLAPLRRMLALFGIDAAYRLDSPDLNSSAINVTLAAQGGFAIPRGTRFSISAMLIYTDNPADPDLFVLSFTFIPTGWTFSEFASPDDLPEHREYIDLNLVDWRQSFLRDVRIQSPVLSARSGEDEELHLSGLLPEAPVFAPYAHMLSPWPLSIEGTVKLPKADQPLLMSLTALTSSSMKLDGSAEKGPNGLTLTSVGLQLGSYGGLDPGLWGDRIAFSELDLIGTLTAGSLVADLSAPLLSCDGLWVLRALFRKDSASLVESMSQLTRLFGMPSLPVPDNFPLISRFKFREIELYVQLPQANGATGNIQSLALTIASDETWVPPVPFKVKVKGVGTRWVWNFSYYDDEQGNSVSLSHVTGSIFGSFEFGAGAALA